MAGSGGFLEQLSYEMEMKILTLKLHCKCCSRPLPAYLVPTNERQLISTALAATSAMANEEYEWSPMDIVEILGGPMVWTKFCKEIGKQSWVCYRGQNLLALPEEISFPQ